MGLGGSTQHRVTVQTLCACQQQQQQQQSALRTQHSEDRGCTLLLGQLEAILADAPCQSLRSLRGYDLPGERLMPWSVSWERSFSVLPSLGN